MHAYLLISQNSNFKSPVCAGRQISNLAAKLKAKIMEFPLVKIEDVRNLNNLIRLKFNEPTLIVCNNIHEAGEEALNAFLKNLEEPQENIYFALTSPSVKKVLPTIVSRCQVVKIANDKLQIPNENMEEMEKFWKMSLGEKLNYVDKIKDRNLAIEFAEELAFFMHGSLHEKELKYNINPEDFRLVLKTLTRLKANGNVNLQLSNFVVQLSNHGK